eukprot:TRINITY_DN6282_c2_g1_i1.p1 TRINITY_DN6282_c2_g1~~TRINITY_DN6282_c2_g1_i1.p1  ORF type:complete len:2152 (+),score=382.10 TRINITY_DN6282_c2_g1_i1:1015-7470(+)
MKRARRKRETHDSDDDEDDDGTSSYKGSIQRARSGAKSDTGSTLSNSITKSRTSHTYSQATDELDDESGEEVADSLTETYHMLTCSENVTANPSLVSLLTEADASIEKNPKTGAPLDLSAHYIGHKHLCFLAHVLVTTGCPISSISLKDSQLHCTVLPAFVTAFKAHKSKLTSLDLSNNPSLAYLSGRELLSLIKTKQKITHLDLSGTSVHPCLMAKIARQLEANKEFVKSSNRQISTEYSLEFYMPRTFLSVYHPPILVSFAAADSLYTSRLCSVLSQVDPRLNGAFALFHHRKTSPDYQEFIKTCFIDADYVLVVASKHWERDEQCVAEMSWFKGRTMFVVVPDDMPEGSVPTLVVKMSSHLDDYSAMDMCLDKQAAMQVCSSSYVLPAVSTTLACLSDSFETTTTEVPTPPQLQFVAPTHRFHLPFNNLTATSQSMDALATRITVELSCSQSFTLPARGEAAELSRWKKLFVLVTQSLVPENPTHVSLYPRLVKRMQLHRQENNGVPFLPKVRSVTDTEKVIYSILAQQASKTEDAKKPKGAIRGGRKRNGDVKATQVKLQDTGPAKQEASKSKSARSAAVMRICFDVDAQERFYYNRLWRKREWVPRNTTPLVQMGMLYVKNPQKLRLRQVLTHEELCVSRKRATLVKESRALRISQRSLAYKVRLINKLEDRADHDKAESVLQLSLLLPHFDVSVVREVRSLKEPRLTDTVRVCAKAVLIVLGEESDEKSLTWWWSMTQTAFAVESQLLYRLANLVPERVRKRQWNRIKDFLAHPFYTLDEASVSHEVWAEEALNGARPRGVIALFARWVHCVYHQYTASRKLEMDAYKYIDELHDDYKQLSDKVTAQEQKVALLEIGVGNLQQHVAEKIREYSTMTSEQQTTTDSSHDPLEKPYADYLRTLQKCSLFNGVPGKALREIALSATLVKYEKRNVIVESDKLLLLVSGRVQLNIIDALSVSLRSVTLSNHSARVGESPWGGRDATVAFDVVQPNPKRHKSFRSVCSLGTGTEISTESTEGATTLHAGQWLFDQAFINALAGEQTECSEVRVSSLGGPRGRPSSLMQISVSRLSEEIRNVITPILVKNREVLLQRAYKMLFLQQLPFLAGIGREVILSIALSVKEVIYEPDQVVQEKGSVTDRLCVVCAGSVAMNEKMYSSVFFPTPEAVLTAGSTAGCGVRASEYGCRLLSLSSDDLYNLCTTFSSLRTRLSCTIEARNEKITVLHNPASYPWSDFNENFQHLLASIPASKAEASARERSLKSLKNTFIHLALPLVEMVVSEIHQDPGTCLLPAVYGAQHTPSMGGYKYVINGVLIEAASNKGNIYGDLGNASKALKHELRAWEQFLGTGARGVCVPLCILVTYRGYRVKAMPLLPLGGRETIVHGGSDGNGVPEELGIHQRESPEVSATLKGVCTMLNIKGHRLPGNRRLFYGPADLEVRKGTDGRYYLLRPGRLFPPQHIKPKTSNHGQWLVQLMRPEAVMASKKALSSDAFSRWETSASNDADVIAECRRLHAEVMPEFAAHLLTLFEDFSVPAFEELEDEKLCAPLELLCNEAHAWGVNIRSFAAVVALLAPSAVNVCRLLYIELLARTFKTTLAQALRSLTKSTAEAVEREITRLLSAFFGVGPSNTAFWRDTLYPNCKRKFGFANLETYFRNIPTMHITTEGVCRVEYLGFTEALTKIKLTPCWHMMMLSRVCKLCGLKLSHNDAKGHYDRLVEVENTTVLVAAVKKRASSRHSMGSASSRRKGRNDESSESVPFHFLDDALPVVRSITIPPSDAVEMCVVRGRLDLAVKKLHEKLTSMKSTVGEDHGSLVKPMVALASVYKEWGKHDSEEEFLQEALDLCVMDLPFDEATGNKQRSFDEASIMIDLADYHHRHGNTGRAAYLLHQAHAVLAELGFDGTNETMVQCLLALGEVEEAQLNHDQAYDAFAEVKAACEAKHVAQTDRVMVESSLGIATSLLGQFDLDACEQALVDVRENVNDAADLSLMPMVKCTEWLVADLKGEVDVALVTLHEGYLAAWAWVCESKGKAMLDAVEFLCKILSRFQISVSKTGKGTSRFEDLMVLTMQNIPEAASIMNTFPNLQDHNLLANAPSVVLSEVVSSDTASKTRKRLAVVLLAKQHRQESCFEQLEILLEAAIATDLY